MHPRRIFSNETAVLKEILPGRNGVLIVEDINVYEDDEGEEDDYE